MMESRHVLRSKLHEGIYQYLIQVARRGDTTTYTDVARLAQLDVADEEDRDRLSQILGMISIYEHQQERPMLSAVVVHAEYRVPGRGFFQLARELGLLKSRLDLEDPLFWYEELKKVHRTWGEMKET